MTQRIVVIGAGFAGVFSALSAARLRDLQGLSPGELEIVVVAPEPLMTVRPRLYETTPGEMYAPLEELFRATEINFVAGSVETIDSATNRVVVATADGARRELAYDRLVLAAGSRLARPPIPGLADFAFSVDRRDEADALDRHLRELVSRPSSAERNTAVIAGGGFTGIETATEFPARMREVLGPDAPIRVILVERNSAVGPDLGPGPRPVIEAALDSLGVERRLGAGVSSLDVHGATLSNGEHIRSATVVWTAGVRATTLTEQVPSQRDKQGRLLVDADLRVPGTPRIFAAGDAANAATDDEGNRTLMSCQHAIPLGKSAGHNAVADLLNLPTKPYTQPEYGTCLDLGPWGAVVTTGWNRVIKTTGTEAKAMKRQINRVWIYPPKADRAHAFAAAEPGIYGVL
ncbi:NAD(P)/FAD-dependent oxidoreductase [Marinivivus vitaminiproducens]|uniref:NAD(P)/FAD-dependent oxidoreductase n=1 Tax=Marinivivus vitaminiproducens TaxID=3035935 RepID=UPI00279AB405|nr:FAD-dependent oxidoreductase [Geminicoccaceae bacterium SCSIO 64248]